MTGGAVSASIAHEVKQPLAGIVTNAYASLRWLDRTKPELDEEKAALKRITVDGLRAGAVIDIIRAIFKKDAGHRNSININELIGEVPALARIEIQRDGI